MQRPALPPELILRRFTYDKVIAIPTTFLFLGIHSRYNRKILTVSIICRCCFHESSERTVGCGMIITFIATLTTPTCLVSVFVLKVTVCTTFQVAAVNTRALGQLTRMSFLGETTWTAIWQVRPPPWQNMGTVKETFTTIGFPLLTMLKLDGVNIRPA